MVVTGGRQRAREQRLPARRGLLDPSGPSNEREKLGISISSEIGDIRSKEDLRAALAGAHTVFHLASLVDVGLKKNPAIEEINVGGTRNVIEVCQELDVPFHGFHYHILVKDFFFSSANAERDLGYRPIVPKDEGMAQTVEWVRTLRISS